MYTELKEYVNAGGKAISTVCERKASSEDT